MVGVSITADSLHAYDHIWGFSIRENAGAAAQVNLRDGAVDGQILVTIPLAANEGVTAVFPRTLPFLSGVYVEVASGAIHADSVLLVDART